MSKPVPIDKLLRDSTAAAVNEAVLAQTNGDIEGKVDWDTRSSYLRSLSSQFQSAADPSRRLVFVSYSVGPSQVYFEVLRHALETAKFEVITGFQQAAGDKWNVLTRVRTQLARCHVYVAIFSRELQVVAPSGEKSWAPSVWTIEEKGMALGLGKPFVLMVEDGIHQDYWRKTTPDRVHHMFNSGNVMAVVNDVCAAVTENYIEQALKVASRSGG